MDADTTIIEAPARFSPAVDVDVAPQPADAHASEPPFDQSTYADMLDGVRSGSMKFTDEPQVDPGSTEEPQIESDPPAEIDDDDDPDQVAPEPKKPNNYRLKPRTEEDRKLFELYKASDKPLAELLAETKPAQAEAEPVTVVASKTPTQELEDRIAEVEQRLSEEDQQFETGKALRSAAELGALKAELRMLKAQEAQKAESESLSRFDAAWNASAAKAHELYGDALTDPAFAEMMKRIDDALEASGDPLFRSAEKPRVIAQMAARELGIAPKSSHQPNGTPKPAVPPKPFKPRPAQGGHVSPPAPTVDPSAVIRTTDDYERLRESLFVNA